MLEVGIRQRLSYNCPWNLVIGWGRKDILKAKHTETKQWFGSCEVTVCLMFLFSFFLPLGQLSAQSNNSTGFSSGSETLPQWVSAIATQGQDQIEVIPFRLDEGLFGEGEDVVRVSLRIFNVLQHFVAVPVTLAPGVKDDNKETNPVVDMEFNSPGMHYASWDRLDNAGNQVVPGVYFVQLYIESEEALDDEPEANEVRVPRRGGLRGFLNTISPGDPFKESVVDAVPMDTRNTVMRIVIS